MADSNFSYFCLGLGIGTAVGLLFAPQTGEESRKELRQRASEGRELVKKRGGELRERAGDALERGRSTVLSQREHLSSALEAGKKAYQEATQEASGENAEAATSS